MHDWDEQQESAGTVDLIGGRLCLDFVNTISWRGGERADDQVEMLRIYADLVAWARHAGILMEDGVARMQVEAMRRPGDAAAVLQRAIALRETLFRIFTLALHGQAADEGDVALFNAVLARTMTHIRITPDADSYAWAWSGDGEELDALLWPVVRSAADLLTSAAELGRMRACAGDRCDWLFLDTSRNHSRRWCSMDDCGNRAKARRHYQRRRVVTLQS